ncbi:MAG: calcium/sodium antiporter [Phycisphaeraceae bacterium]|nr:MAG: calcium/sodium antiporter [Phycisphaeraceae bacterium]
MLSSLGLLLLGLILLVIGGEALLRGAVGLAALLRLTPAVIGLTVVAAGTSVPELAVSGIAASRGSADIAVANVVGSNIFNLAFILGLAALIRPMGITGNTIRLEYPVLAIVTLLCLVIAQDGTINRLDAALCLAVYVGFTVYMVMLVRQQVTAAEDLELRAEITELSPAREKPRPWICAGLVVLGVALLDRGAAFTVSGAVDLARMLGWSERIIGLTIVSVGTSLPEVVASAVSAIRGRSDVAIGNLIGSNLFNILMILGIVSLISPLTVQPALLESDCWWMLGVTLAIFPIMATGRRVNRLEGLALLATYGVYLATLMLTTSSPHS